MSVNGLFFVSSAHMASTERRSAPLKLQSNHIHNVHIQGEQQTDGALVPAEE